MADRFPYDEASLDAMIDLVNRHNPDYHLDRRVADFNDLYFSPSMNRPGQTYVQLKLPAWDRERTFVYDRLDINVALDGPIDLELDGDVTPRAVALAINEQLDMSFGPDDVDFSRTVLAPAGSSVRLKVQTRRDSLVWYGQVFVNINAAARLENARLMENNTPRRLENGQIRYMEAS